MMNLCLRNCGLYVPADGPSTCGACLAGDAACDAMERLRQINDERLDQTVRLVGPHEIRTKGRAIYVAMAPANYPEGRLMMTSEAEEFARIILGAVAHVTGLRSPYKSDPTKETT